MAVTWQTSMSEMGSRWFSGLSPAAWLGVEVGLLGIGLMGLLLMVRARAAVWRIASVVFALGAAGGSIRLALLQSWLADDAFITFRYARNLVEGHGLVWNVGERLEGYTNFLWTVLIAFAQLFGVSPGHSSTAMTLGCIVLLAVVGAWKLGRPGWIPLAPALLVLSPAFIEFGTSGLEAGPAAMCIGFAALFLADEKRRHLAAWWVLVAALLRPDHALFFAPLGLLQLFAGRTPIRHTVAAGIGFGLYWLGRWAYFGELFPNTFHAKSGGGAYWEQGSLYWAEFSLATGAWLAVPLVFALALLLAIPQRAAREPLPRAALAFSFIGAALFGLYIARVGGDFMEFRFGLTSFVLFAFGADALLSRLAGERIWATVLAGIALLPLGLAPRVIKDGEKKWHIARESSFYRVKTWFPLEVDTGNWAMGKALASLPEGGAKAPPLAAGCIGVIGYLSHVNIVDRYGLTNARIARKPIKERGRPGHEKWATDDELRAEGAEWSVDPSWDEPLQSKSRFRLNNVNFWVLRHTPALAAAMKLPEPRDVLSAIRSPEEAAHLEESVSKLYAELPRELEIWRARWDLFDVREFKVEGQSVEQTLSRVSAKDTLKLSLHRPCVVPNRLRWKVSQGKCSLEEAVCVNGNLDTEVTCTGPEISLQHFVFEPTDFQTRLQRGLALGPESLANVVREQDDSLPGLVTRFRFDSPLELTRPEVERAGRTFDVSYKPAAGQGVITGVHGSGFLNGFAWGDGPVGSMRIAVPVEPGKPVLVSFLYAGSSACERVRARVVDGPLEVLKACGRQDEILRPHSTVIAPRTAQLVLEVIDEDAKAWGHALVDDVLLWNLPSPDAPTAEVR